jgi:hypothetical protein
MNRCSQDERKSWLPMTMPRIRDLPFHLDPGQPREVILAEDGKAPQPPDASETADLDRAPRPG